MKKKFIAVLCSIIMVIPLVFSVPKADNSYTTHTSPTVSSYGQYYSSSSYFEDLVSYELGPAAINIPVSNATSFTFVYEFYDTYDGFINLSLTAVNSFAWNTTYFYCDGCTLIQQPNMSNVSKVKTFGLHFQNAKKISFTVIHETNSSGAINADKIFYDYLAGTSTTFSITSSNFNVVPDVADDLHYLRGRWDFYIPGMSSSLSSIDSSLNNIETDIDSIDDYINNDLNLYLSNITGKINTISSDLTTLKSYLDGVEGYIDQIEGYIDTIETKLNTISSSVTNIYNYLKYKVPIWRLPALLFGSMTPSSSQANQTYYQRNNPNYSGFVSPYFSINKNYYDNSFTSYNSFKIQRDIPIILVWLSPKNANFGEFGHPSDTIRIQTQIPNQVDQGTFIQSWGINCQTYDNYNLHYIVIYTTRGSQLVEIEFNPTISASGPGSSSFLFSPLYFGSYNNVPDEIRQLINLDYDNTYTRLLQQIVNGVGGASYDTSQYDQYEQTIDGLNDNMRDRFNNSESNFQNSINNILTPDQTAGGSNTIFERFHFNAINSVFTGFLSDLFTAAPTLQYVLLFGLLLLVLGVFI